MLPRSAVDHARHILSFWQRRNDARYWRLRIDDVIARPDNRHIARVPDAGKFIDGQVVMHNGIRVGGLSYYEAGILNMLIENVGSFERTDRDGRRFVAVDPFCERNGIEHLEHLEILHADIQGGEADMLTGAKMMLGKRAVDWLFISTHSNKLHYECVEKLKSYGYVIMASADLDETYSTDGLIVAKAYVQKVAFGDNVIDMPLFLAPGWYVEVPLEATHQAAWRGVPRRGRDQIEPATRDR